MRVLLDARECGDPRTGMGRYALETRRALGRRGGHDYLTLLAPGANGAWSGQGPALRSRIAAYSPLEHLTLPLLDRRLDVQLHHCFTYALPLVPAAPSSLSLFDVVPLLFPAQYRPRARLYWRSILPRTLARARLVVTLSRTARRDLLARFEVDPRRVEVVPPGVGEPFTPGPADAARLLALGARPPYLLAHGNHRPHKNLPALLAAFAGLRRGHPGFQLVLSGGALAAPERDGVLRVGRIDDADLVALYRGAALYVLPSLYEGAGLTPLEAMACGAPCLLAARGALPELHGGAAALSEPDPASLAASLAALLGDPGRRRELAAAGLERARSATWAASAACLEGLLERAARS